MIADWSILSRILPYKTDAGTGSLEQMALAEFCKTNFNSHVKILRSELQKKSEAMCYAFDKYFGSSIINQMEEFLFGLICLRK